MAASPVLDFDLNAYVLPRRKLVEQRLDEYVPLQEPRELWESMRYSLLSGGKRLRALLCIAAAEAASTAEGDVNASARDGADRVSAASDARTLDLVLPCACAIEMVHAMSLIHDDLPCMDNDDFRRGKPTNHKVFGEAMALLAGDALLVLASETLIRRTADSVAQEILLDVAAELARASGPEGMVGGQVFDFVATGLQGKESAGQTLTAELLESIHKRKTGALLRFSVWSGARLVAAPERVLKPLARFGEILGLAFQIADDLLDLTGDLQTLGKTPGKDQAAGKLTWISVYGERDAREALHKLESDGKAALEATSLASDALSPLKALLSYAVRRKN